jgi:Fe-S-cluster containining protein
MIKISVTMTGTPFYASGLRFSCIRCSSCCRYEAGFVFLSEKDMEKLVSELKMNRNGFLKTYCRWVADWKGDQVLSLKEKSNKDCVFWDSGCTVYAARPLQCVSFPFWESIISSPEAWEIAAESCPGMNRGALHTAGAIEERIKMRASQPIIDKQEGMIR